MIRLCSSTVTTVSPVVLQIIVETCFMVVWMLCAVGAKWGWQSCIVQWQLTGF